MSDTKHTPGPWAFVQDGLTLVRGVSDDDFHQVVAACASDFLTNAECEANASLIAAAPDLLDALKLALDWIDAIPDGTLLPVMPGFDRDWVNDLIAKAEGRT